MGINDQIGSDILNDIYSGELAPRVKIKAAVAGEIWEWKIIRGEKVLEQGAMMGTESETQKVASRKLRQYNRNSLIKCSLVVSRRIMDEMEFSVKKDALPKLIDF